MSSKKNNKKRSSLFKTQRETEHTRNTETYPDDHIEPIIPQYTAELAESLFSNSFSEEILIEDFKVHSFSFENTETILLEYNTTTQVLEKIGLGLHLFPESGCLELLSRRIICAGGIDVNCFKEVKNVFLINTGLREISEVSEMLFVKRKLRLLELNEYVYAIGGVKELRSRVDNAYTLKQDYRNSFSRYSIRLNEWVPLSEMPFPVELPGCFEINEKIYVTGGCILEDFMIVINKIQVYDVCAMTWNVLEIKIPENVYGHLCAKCEDNVIIIFGGVTEELTPNLQCWTWAASGISYLNNLPQGHEMFLPYYPSINHDEIFAFTEDNDLVLYNVKLSSWTISAMAAATGFSRCSLNL